MFLFGNGIMVGLVDGVSIPCNHMCIGRFFGQNFVAPLFRVSRASKGGDF